MPSLIFIPGWGIHPIAYHTLTEALSEENGVSVLDYAFFSEPETFDFRAAAFTNFDFSRGDLVLCCHSMGTLPALKYAAELKNIKALVLISPFAKFTQDDGYEAQNPVKIDLMLRQLNKSPHKMLEAFYSSMAPSHDFTLPVPENLKVERLAAGLEFLKTTDCRKFLSLINIPVLILHGEKDLITEKPMADYLAGNLKKCDYRIVPGAGHSLPLEKGRGCATAIEDFLINNKLD